MLVHQPCRQPSVAGRLGAPQQPGVRGDARLERAHRQPDRVLGASEVIEADGRGRDGTRIDRGARQRGEQRAEVGRRGHVVGTGVVERVSWHRRVPRVVRVLDDADAAVAADEGEPGGAVVEHPREHHADHSRPERAGGRAEQRVGRRAVTVLPADHGAARRGGRRPRAGGGGRHGTRRPGRGAVPRRSLPPERTAGRCDRGSPRAPAPRRRPCAGPRRWRRAGRPAPRPTWSATPRSRRPTPPRRRCRAGRRSSPARGVGDDRRGDVAQLRVGALRLVDEAPERVVGRAAQRAHDDPLRLGDGGARGQCLGQLL